MFGAHNAYVRCSLIVFTAEIGTRRSSACTSLRIAPTSPRGSTLLRTSSDMLLGRICVIV